MKSFCLALLMLGISTLSAQTRKEIDWAPCQRVTDTFRAEVEKFNSEHKDGLSIMLSCTYGGRTDIPKKPERHVALTSSEIAHHRALRRLESAAIDAIVEYQTYLLRVHHIRDPKPGDPCFHFVGFVLDSDYITVDPNPMSPDAEGCAE